MTVSQVIGMAASGELSTLAVKDDTNIVLGYINLGLIELYKRFPLNVKEHIIELQDGITDYSTPDDFMWMVEAYGEVEEAGDVKTFQLPVNEETNPDSVNVPGWDTIQVPTATDGAYISIIYVASPEVLTEADLDNRIPVPAQMVEALLHYVGYRAHGALDGNIQAENSTHYQRFEASCNRIEQRGMLTVDGLDMYARDMKGFV